MNNKINKWLNNPIYYRFGFFIILFINALLYYFNIHHDHLYVFYILATILLGIGFYNMSALFLVCFTILLVIFRSLLSPEESNLTSFLFLLFTYLLIMLISVGLMKRNQKIKKDNFELIIALSKALDSRDTYTSNHTQNVARYALEIAKKMKLPKDVCEVIYKGGLLHDIGKIGIPETVLLKPARLNDDEYKIIKRHPVIGYDIIKHISDFNENGILDIVLHHHERYDGTGYPKGLKGEQIPLAARIMAIADTFDAMTSTRVYRHEINLENTLSEI